MNTKTYHLMDKTEWLTLIDLFHPAYGSHYINLPNGRILLAASFSHEGSEEMFHMSAKTMTSLPHPVFQGTDPISVAHANELAAHSGLFPEPNAQQVAAKCTVRDIIARAAKEHPLMRLTVF